MEQSALPEISDGEALAAAVAICAVIECFAAAERRQRLQQTDARARLRRQHYVHAPSDRRPRLPGYQTLCSTTNRPFAFNAIK